jgi:Gram-negative bacterial TonB protein C-terminal
LRITILVALIALSATFVFGQTNKTYDTPMKIINKPRAVWKDGQDCSTGTITLRVEFLDSSKIGKISLVSGINKNRNESAIEVAKKIIFKPAMKDGQPVTVSKQIQYNFTLY